MQESLHRISRKTPFKTSILAQFHTLSFIFSVMAIATHLRLCKYETTITIVQEILSRITAWSPMVGTPINQVQRLINQCLIKDLILPLLSVDLWNDERAGKKGGVLLSFQRSTDSNGEIRSLIRPWLISLRTWSIGVPTIGLRAVILLKISCTINNPTQLLSQTIYNYHSTWCISHSLRTSSRQAVFIQNSFCLNVGHLSTLWWCDRQNGICHSCSCHAKRMERQCLLIHRLVNGTGTPEIVVMEVI